MRVADHRHAVAPIHRLVEQQIDHAQEHAVRRRADVEHPFADVLVRDLQVDGEGLQPADYRGSAVQCSRLDAHSFHVFVPLDNSVKEFLPRDKSRNRRTICSDSTTAPPSPYSSVTIPRWMAKRTRPGKSRMPS